MSSDFLILLFCLIYLAAQLHLFKVDVFFAAYYFYLFVYCIFAVVGYLYFPNLSSAISAYFGAEIETGALLFLILSFTFVYLALILASRSGTIRQVQFAVGRARFNYAAATGLAVSMILGIQALGFFSFGEALSYANASDPEFLSDAGLYYKLWFTAFKLSPTVITVLYAVLRFGYWPGAAGRGLLYALLLAETTIFLLTAHAVGNRLELVSLINAVIFVELICRSGKRSEKSGTFYMGVAVALAVALAYMFWLSRNRASDPFEGLALMETVLFQDYFSPAHMLFAAIAHNLIMPAEVLISNAMNSLVLMNHPYLQQTVADVINPGVSSRSTGYAFYVLAEGYMALGMAGFLYNAAVIGLGMGLWRRLAATESAAMNCLLLPILAIDLVNLCRGQSAYFIKNIYFHFIPALFLIFLATGHFVRGIRFRRSAP